MKVLMVMVTRLGNKSMTATEKSRSFSEKNHLHRPPFLLIIIFSRHFLTATLVVTKTEEKVPLFTRSVDRVPQGNRTCELLNLSP